VVAQSISGKDSWVVGGQPVKILRTKGGGRKAVSATFFAVMGLLGNQHST